MRTKTITLPNGFMGGGELIRKVEIRKLGGKEEDLLVDKEELKKGTVLYSILKNCTVAMGGTEEPSKIANFYDNNFLLADITFMLVELRIWGIDPEYSFEHQCPSCETIGRHIIDLSTLLVEEQKDEYRGKTKYLSLLHDAPKPFDEAGNPLAEKHWSYGEVPFVFRPLVVQDQKMLEAIRSDYPKQRATRELSLQIVEYCNQQGIDVKTLQSFDSGTRAHMREEIDKVSGGVNSEIIMTCKKCSRSYKDNVPVDTKHFFFQAGDSLETRRAIPFRAAGMTPTSLDSVSAGHPAKSSDSLSKSASST